MIQFSIITPSFKRISFIKKIAKNVVAQTYPHWRWYVIHDGPNEEYKIYFSKCLDGRINFQQLDEQVGDWGYAPRLKGLKDCDKSDKNYCLLWDDDNYYPPNVLQIFCDDLVANDFPDYLLVRIIQGGTSLPSFSATMDELGPHTIDTACLVIKTEVALEHFSKIGSPGKNRGQDATLFLSLRADKKLRGIISSQKPLIVYDGARPLQNLRWRMGIPKLGVANWKIYREIRAFLRR